MPQSTESLFHRYHAAWEAKDADRIAALHSEDSTFKLHDNSPRVHGRSALRDHFAEMFRRLPDFSFQMHRTIFGDRHWVFEWSMVVPLPGGPATIDMVDVVDLNEAGEVLRKDVYINGEQARAFYAQAEMAPA